MKTKRAFFAATVAGLFLLPVGTSTAEVICGKSRPIKPVHSVCGKLIDPAGGPLAGTRVKVSKDGTDLATIQTGSDGVFIFGELKPGSYELTASFDGLKPFRSSIVVTNPAKKCKRGLTIVLALTYPDNCGSYVMKQ
ncbi:exported hypothetical protein [Candidatus Sulfopaludibacter sp. SbA3]|nr:exported hypothetical protein [Candidatus Sulfopaludibacter sp. SbA3]